MLVAMMRRRTVFLPTTGVSFGRWMGPVSKELQCLLIPASCSPLSDRDVMLAGEDWREPNTDLLRCGFCSAQYKCLGSLKRHIRQSHMNQPVFRCKICQAGFMYKDHYVGHMNKHNNTPTFKCTKCPKMFIYKGDMYKHRKLCKSGEGEGQVTHTDTDNSNAESKRD